MHNDSLLLNIHLMTDWFVEDKLKVVNRSLKEEPESSDSEGQKTRLGI